MCAQVFKKMLLLWQHLGTETNANATSAKQAAAPEASTSVQRPWVQLEDLLRHSAWGQPAKLSSKVDELIDIAPQKRTSAGKVNEMPERMCVCVCELV